MELYTYNNLKPLIGEEVSVIDADNNTSTLKISAVEKSNENNQWDVFSVIFLADKDLNLQQGIYTISHSQFGEPKLFMCPNSIHEYETVISTQK